MYTPIDKLSLPAVLAPMFLINGPDLVTAACTSGIIGTFPALNQRSTEGFDQWLTDIEFRLSQHHKETGETVAPYGVNLIVHHTNPRLQADLEIVVKHKVPIVITSLGAVTDVIDAVHSYGGLVFHDVINRRHAEKAAEAGADGLILVSAGAGGHAGLINPMAFIHEIRSFYNKTILLSGCISTGQDIAAAMQMGADLAYMGTRFINTIEANADKEYQEMIIDSGADDIVYTAAISGVSANFLKKSLVDSGVPPEMWTMKKKIDFGEELDADKAKSKAWKNIWSAGQGVSAIDDILPISNLVHRLRNEFYESIERQSRWLNRRV